MSLVPTSSILSNFYSPSSIRSLAVWYDMYNTDYVAVIPFRSSVSTLYDKSGFRNHASTIISGAGTTGIPYLPNGAPNKGGCIYFANNLNQWIQVPDKTRDTWSWFVLINGPAFQTPSGNFASRWYGGRGILDGSSGTANVRTYGMSLLSTSLACGVGISTSGIQSTIYVSSLTSWINQYVPQINQRFYTCEFMRSTDSGYMEALINGGSLMSTIGETGTRTLLTGGLRLGSLTWVTNATLSNARFYEVLMYSTFLSIQDRQQVEGYLAWKWGFPQQLPSDHPYRYNPFIITPEPTPIQIPDNIFLVPINTYSSIKTFMFPAVNTNPGRVIVLKDSLGYANRNPIYISTQGTDVFQDLYSAPTSYGILSTSYGAWTFQNDGISKWFVTSEYNNSIKTYSPNSDIYPSGPRMYLDPSISTFFPLPISSLNISTIPTNMTTFLNFSGEGSQYIDFGQQTFDFSTNGFGIKTKLMFTQVRGNNQVILNFYDALNRNTILLRTTGFSFSSILGLDFYYQSSVNIVNTNYRSPLIYRAYISTNTMYDLTVNYLPIRGAYGNLPFGAMTLWLNGTCILSNTTNVLSGNVNSSIVTFTNTTLGRPLLTGDTYPAARMYKFGVYERSLSDIECAYRW